MLWQRLKKYVEMLKCSPSVAYLQSVFSGKQEPFTKIIFEGCEFNVYL